jgi:hypothetical protein
MGVPKTRSNQCTSGTMKHRPFNIEFRVLNHQIRARQKCRLSNDKLETTLNKHKPLFKPFKPEHPISLCSPSLLPTTKHTPKVSTRALRPLCNRAAHLLRPTSNALPRTLSILDNRITVARRRAAIVPLVVFPAALGSVDAFFRHHVTDGSEEAVVADLVADEVVDVVLELVDLWDAGDFGFVEGVCQLVYVRNGNS